MEALIHGTRTEVGERIKVKVLEALSALKQIDPKERNDVEVESALKTFASDWNQIETLKALGGEFKRQGKAKAEIAAFRDALDDWISFCVESLGGEMRQTFLELLRDFRGRYEALKREHSALDFNDLERKALDLLSGEKPQSAACRELYQRHFKFVMVDEFQDTSFIQDRLIDLLSRPDNLFIVGDWKQSVYGFRGAEASLFLKREETFSREGRRIALVENFRSRSELLNQINPFFKELWVGVAGVFEPLQAARDFPAKKTTSVEFLVIEREEEETIEEARMKEARVLAERIREFVEAGTYAYRDFAMLFRVATNMYFYEHELRNLGIPYYVIGGRGFYWQPEIRDLMNILELLENPHLDIPLAAVLRSPLVQISDDTLFWLAQASKRINPNVPLYHAFLKSDEIPEIKIEDQERLNSFRAFFLDLLAQKEKWTVSECLERILEHTKYDRYVLGLPQGKRHFANLRKLLELARELETREPIHLGDFIRYVQGLETQEVRESEAQVEALEGDVVKLMTVHKAKGLEFKVVILPDLGSVGEKRFGDFLMDAEYGLGLKVFNPLTREPEEGWTYLKIKAGLEQKAREESKRLLYVGMTRAEDHLILSGTSKNHAGNSEGHSANPPPSGNKQQMVGDEDANWFEWLNRWTSSGSAAFHRQVIQAPARRGGRIPYPLAERKKIRRALEKGEPVHIREPKEVSEIIERLKPITPAYFERFDLPVSAFAAFDHDPEEYKRQYELGVLPEESKPKQRGAGNGLEVPKSEEWAVDEDESELSAARFGTIIHGIFEHLVLDPAKAAQRFPKLLERFSGTLDEGARTEVRKLSERFLRSRLFEEIKQAKSRHAEIPFVLRLHYGIVQGTLDLLYQTPSGEWVILDYKTSQIDDGGFERTGERYRTQMMFYALACFELLKISPERASVYFARYDRVHDFLLKGIDFSKVRSDFESLQKRIIETRKTWVT